MRSPTWCVQGGPHAPCALRPARSSERTRAHTHTHALAHHNNRGVVRRAWQTGWAGRGGTPSSRCERVRRLRARRLPCGARVSARTHARTHVCLPACPPWLAPSACMRRPALRSHPSKAPTFPSFLAVQCHICKTNAPSLTSMKVHGLGAACMGHGSASNSIRRAHLSPTRTKPAHSRQPGPACAHSRAC